MSAIIYIHETFARENSVVHMVELHIWFVRENTVTAVRVYTHVYHIHIHMYMMQI